MVHGYGIWCMVYGIWCLFRSGGTWKEPRPKVWLNLACTKALVKVFSSSSFFLYIFFGERRLGIRMREGGCIHYIISDTYGCITVVSCQVVTKSQKGKGRSEYA